MSTIDQAHDVRQMAANLGLDWRRPPSETILEYCQSRIAGWLRNSPLPSSLSALEAMICRHLRLVLEEFYSDGELDALIEKYVTKGEFVFAAQRDGFDDETFATLIRREHATPTCPDQFVALIDCRGNKTIRRYFTRWHEIAHVLTLVNGQMSIPFHRSTKNRDPVEQLMDKIAGEIGFYQPIFVPAIATALGNHPSLSMDAVEAVRLSVCPAASFETTLYAVMRHIDTPAMTIEAGLELKNSERRMLESPGLFATPAPEPKLRVIKTGGNAAAAATRLRIHNHMRVPEASIIAKLFGDPLFAGPGGTARAVEDLGDWTTSEGESLPSRTVTVEARRRGDQVFAIITPA